MGAFVVPQLAKMLRNLDHWIEKAAAHAEARSFDVNVLVHARLAPDQYDFARQVQAACDAAKFCAAYLAGKQAPSHPDVEQTFPELRERIQKCLSFLETIQEKDWDGFEARKVSPRWLGGKWIPAEHYLVQFALPNFYFHVTTAYAILRHNGVDLGKMDYIGSLPVQEG